MQSKNTGYKHNATPEVLNKYFGILNNRFQLASSKNDVIVKYYNIAGKTIKLEILNKEFTDRISTQLKICETEELPTTDVTLKIWQDDISSYIPDNIENAKGLFLWDKESLLISVLFNENRLEAYDKDNSIMYFSALDFSPQAIANFGHLFIKLFNLAINDNETCIVHSGAIGIGKKGVLIVGKGGSGKSTLALSGLINGCSYVSDDYVVLKRSLKTYAFPIYSMAYLSPEIKRKLPELDAKYLCMNYNNEKYMLDIASYHSNFVKDMEISAVVFPEISDFDAPIIEKVHPGKAIVQMVYSTICQSGDSKNKDKIKQIISYISNLPFYKIKLSPDLRKNALILKDFIEKEI